MRGPWVTARYHKLDRPDSFPGGWLATGDIASLTPGGALIIRDRSKDVIKSGGEWVSSIDLEKKVAELSFVEAVAVVAQPHPKWDERPVCVLTLKEGEQRRSNAELTSKIRKHLAPNFAKYELPDEALAW